jgi:hypothetical protein
MLPPPRRFIASLLYAPGRPDRRIDRAPDLLGHWNTGLLLSCPQPLELVAP